MVFIKQDDLVESNHSGIVTPATLAQLNLLNHAWVSISCKEVTLHSDSTENSNNDSVAKVSSGVSVAKCFEKFEKRKDDYVVQLKVKDYDYTDLFGADNHTHLFDAGNLEEDGVNVCADALANGIIYVSPAALFNILKQDVKDYVKYRTRECKVELHPLGEFDSSNKSDYASHVDISLISCPFGSLELEKIDNILNNFFTVPTVLSVGEIFNIPLKQTSFNTPLCLWFSVKTCNQTDEKHRNINTNSLFVSSQCSNLYLSNPVNSYVPQCPCTYRNNRRLLKVFWNESYREAFRKSKEQLCSLLSILQNQMMQSKDTTVLFEGCQGVGKGLMIRSFCEEFCLHFHEENCFDLIGESLTATEKRIEKLFELVTSVVPCVLYLKNVDLLCKDKEGTHEERRTLHCFKQQLANLSNNFPVLIIGSTSNVKEVTPRFHSEFLYHIHLSSPDESNRLLLIQTVADGFNIDDEIVSDLVKKTSGFVFADFIALFTKIFNKGVQAVDASYQKSNVVSKEIVEAALEELRIIKAGSKNAICIPKVKWDDVGGLHDVKKDILDTIELPLKFPNLFSSGLQRSGLLFYGPPGCGKTLLAKAIATEFTLNFYSVKGPELINMYVGQSEENVRNVFAKARSMTPCIIFFDELDSIAPNRGRSGDSGGVMDRIVSQLLSELDGMHDNIDIFIIGATNRPDLLDPALLRPGRFDKVVYVGIAEDREERLRILKAVTHKLRLSEDVDLDALVDQCPVNLTGADFSALASEALLNCYRRLIGEHELHGVQLNPHDVVITLDDMHSAFQTLVPSVSMSELERYKLIRGQMMERT